MQPYRTSRQMRRQAKLDQALKERQVELPNNSTLEMFKRRITLAKVSILKQETGK